MAKIIIDCGFFKGEVAKLECIRLKEDSEIDYQDLTDVAKMELIEEVISSKESQKINLVLHYELNDTSSETFKKFFELANKKFINDCICESINTFSSTNESLRQGNYADSRAIQAFRKNYFIDVYTACVTKLNAHTKARLFQFSNYSLPEVQLVILDDESLDTKLLNKLLNLFLNSFKMDVRVLQGIISHKNFVLNEEICSLDALIKKYECLKRRDIEERKEREKIAKKSFKFDYLSNDFLKNISVIPRTTYVNNVSKEEK